MPYELRRNRSRTRGRGATEVNGQYRVTVPDPDALDRLRTRNHVYDRTLQPRERFVGGSPTEVRSLPGSSRESSTEPMDTDEGARTTRQIAENIRRAQGRTRAGSVGHTPRDLTFSLAGDQESRGTRRGGGSKPTPGECSLQNGPRGRPVVAENPPVCYIGSPGGGGPQPLSPCVSGCYPRSGPATRDRKGGPAQDGAPVQYPDHSGRGTRARGGGEFLPAPPRTAPDFRGAFLEGPDTNGTG